MKGLNNRQKMVVKADQNVQKFLKEAQRIRKGSQQRKTALKKIGSYSRRKSS